MLYFTNQQKPTEDAYTIEDLLPRTISARQIKCRYWQYHLHLRISQLRHVIITEYYKAWHWAGVRWNKDHTKFREVCQIVQKVKQRTHRQTHIHTDKSVDFIPQGNKMRSICKRGREREKGGRVTGTSYQAEEFVRQCLTRKLSRTWAALISLGVRDLICWFTLGSKFYR
jgi:hypothetical protein